MSNQDEWIKFGPNKNYRREKKTFFLLSNPRYERTQQQKIVNVIKPNKE